MTKKNKIQVIDKSRYRPSSYQKEKIKDNYYIIIGENENGEKIAFDSEFMGK
jgi:hypothetical protein